MKPRRKNDAPKESVKVADAAVEASGRARLTLSLSEELMAAGRSELLSRRQEAIDTEAKKRAQARFAAPWRIVLAARSRTSVCILRRAEVLRHSGRSLPVHPRARPSCCTLDSTPCARERAPARSIDRGSSRRGHDCGFMALIIGARALFPGSFAGDRRGRTRVLARKSRGV